MSCNLALKPADPGSRAHSTGDLLAMVYHDLHRLAKRRLRNEPSTMSLQPTALVHEVFLRLSADGEACWANRAHFFAAAGEAMRRILVDLARRRMAAKRGHGQKPYRLHRYEPVWKAPAEQVIAVHEALEELAARDPVKANLVKLRYFVGMSHSEAAKALGLSRSTADRHWAYARAWLYTALCQDGDHPAEQRSGQPR